MTTTTPMKLEASVLRLKDHDNSLGFDSSS